MSKPTPIRPKDQFHDGHDVWVVLRALPGGKINMMRSGKIDMMRTDRAIFGMFLYSEVRAMQRVKSP